MGKYMKKPKFTSFNVLPMDSSTVGVCTRAKSLSCLQTSASFSDDDSSSYLELRSRRRLKKAFYVSQRRGQVQKPISQLIIKSSPSARSSPFRTPTSSRQRNSGPNKSSSGNKLVAGGNHFDVGDDNLNFLTNERVTRGSTYSHDEANNTPTDHFMRDMPSSRELEAFFAAAQVEQQRKFMDKYNFDIVADKPLPDGRYEWCGLIRISQ